jgi:hypothetical protein
MIATSGAVAEHRILRMLLVARVAEWVGGITGHSQVKTRSAAHALGRRFRIHVEIFRASPIRQQGAAVGYFRSRLLLALSRELRTRIQAAVEHGLMVGKLAEIAARASPNSRIRSSKIVFCDFFGFVSN